MKALILFLIYDPEKTERVRNALYEITERCASVDFTLVEIDNADTDLPWMELGSEPVKRYCVGGDNSAQEFTGWDFGWRQATEILGTGFDIVLVTNDALLNSKDINQLSVVDDQLLHVLVRHGMVAGWVDTFARVYPDPVNTLTAPYRIFGDVTRQWLCSCFMLIPLDVFATVFPLTRLTDSSSLYNEDFSQGIFQRDCGLSEGYQDFLITHQSRVWMRNGKRGYQINRETFDKFRAKTRSIINEHLLGIRLRKAGCPLLSLPALYGMKPGMKRVQASLSRTPLGAMLPRLATLGQFLWETLSPAVAARCASIVGLLSGKKS
jgi:hypothetical protein